MTYLTPQDRLLIANNPVNGLEWVAERIAERVREQIAQAIEEHRIECPIHHIPDCGPLLNGCSLPNRLHVEKMHAARIARENDFSVRSDNGV